MYICIFVHTYLLILILNQSKPWWTMVTDGVPVPARACVRGCVYVCVCVCVHVCTLHCWLTSSSSLFALSYAYSEEVHQRMALRTWLNVVTGTVVQLDRSVHYSVYTHRLPADMIQPCDTHLYCIHMCNMYVHACVCTYVHMHNTYVCNTLYTHVHMYTCWMYVRTYW